MVSVFYYLIAASVSFLLVLMIVPSVILIAQKNNLFDDHSLSRKDHGYGIPRLGGIAFFTAIVLTSLLIVPERSLPMYEFYAASIILFAVGVKDDLLGVHCHTKMTVQAIAALLITVPGNVRITSLHGFFQIYQLPVTLSLIVSVLIIMLVINAFNLIDGIDGLAATLGVIACCTFGYFFMIKGENVLAVLAFSAVGALTAFLTFNFSPASIFMGDAGSMFIGMICAVFAIKFISINKVPNLNLQNVPLFALSVLIVPVADTFSVVFIRLKNKKSPFKPDRNHIHHRLLRLGLSHVQTTLLLAGITAVFVMLAIALQNLDSRLLFVIFLLLLITINSFINHLQRSKSKQVYPVGSILS